MSAFGFDRSSFYSAMDRAESEIAAQIRMYIGPIEFPSTFGRLAGLANWAGFDMGQRVMRVQRAISDSQRIAFGNLQKKLGGINLQDIWPLLAEICHDLALYIGGGAIAGGAIGSGLGFMVLGVGAIPGAIAGTALGAKLGGMLLNIIGLKSVTEFIIDNVPLAIDEYQKGLVEAWGPVPSLDGTSSRQLPSSFCYGDSGFAADHLAAGHEIVIVSLLMGIVAYIARGKGNLQAIIVEAQASKALSAKFAKWLEENAAKLTAIPMLQARRKGAGQIIVQSQPTGRKRKPLKKEVAKSAVLDAIAVRDGRAASGQGAQAQVPVQEVELSSGSVTKNALEPHEAIFAEEIVAHKGGELVGAPAHSFPGIDGTLDGTPISLKETQGGLSSVLKHASKAEAQAANAGYSGVDLYIKAPNIGETPLVDFAKNGPLSAIPNQGVISNIYVYTRDGWVLIGGGK